jgi:hypothetical protein
MVDPKARERVRAKVEISRATGVPPSPYFSKPPIHSAFAAKKAMKPEDTAKKPL